MALITCPECGKPVSDKAAVCIHCGYPLKESTKTNDGAEETTVASVSGSSEAQALEMKDDTTENQAILIEETDDAATEQDDGKNDGTGRKKKPLIIAGIAVVLLAMIGAAFYIFYYRPHYVPKAVENEPYTVQMNGADVSCIYTGIMLDAVPQGEGLYVISDDGSSWTYEGILDENNMLSSGVVTDMPITITSNLGSVDMLYSGGLQNGEMVDSVEVSDLPLRLEYDTKTYDGVYTGTMFNGAPEGYGTFEYSKSNLFFEYTGGWAEGYLSGEGTLYSNDVTVHFSEVDRDGTYNGDVLDGVFCGEGSFEATTGDGIDYSYEGEWQNGLWDGEGKQVYDTDNYYNRIGQFKDGEFTPTVFEAFVSLGTCKTDTYIITDKAKSFLSMHQTLFLMDSKDDIEQYIDTEFSYNLFAKNPGAYGDHLFKVSGLHVFQVFEKEDYWGRSMTSFLAYDRNYDIYSGVLLGLSDKIVEGKTITLYALPLDYSTYDGVDGSKYWALRFAAVYVE